MKTLIRKLLILFHLDLTRNLKYDRLTIEIIKKCVQQNSNCIDIGAHKGEILQLFVDFAPKGQHYAFEPIPLLNQDLQRNFPHVTTLACALGERKTTTTFNYVKNAPAYSGLKKRKYAISDPEIENFEVEVERLDEIIPEDFKVDFIKIDVEGGEFDVLKGASKILLHSKPIIVFECGLGASEFYGVNPSELFHFLNDNNYEIFTLQAFMDSDSALNEEEFDTLYNLNKEYYFVIAPKQH